VLASSVFAWHYDAAPVDYRTTNTETAGYREYESIASAHFDFQEVLRQQFRFYVVIAAVPLTILGLAYKGRSSHEIEHLGLFDLPPFSASVFLGIGVLGILLLLSMCTLLLM
jgi:hypothetical protein